MWEPDYKYRQALAEAAKEHNHTDDECEMLTYIRAKRLTGIVANHDLHRAHEIFVKARQSKLLMEALLLAPDGTAQRVADSMNASLKMVKYYETYFFDKKVFEDYFAITDYVNSLSDDQSKITKTMAMSHGFYHVLSVFNGGDLNLTALQINKKIQAEAYVMFSQTRGQVITSEVAKEAKSWASVIRAATDYISKADAENEKGNFSTEFKVLFKTAEPLPVISDIEGEVIHG